MGYQEDEMSPMKGDGEDERVSQERLNELHQILEREWISFERSFKPRTHGRRFWRGSESALQTLHLLQNSPKTLVASIQQRSPPSQETWSVRNNELALEEALGNRNGRRLFTEEDEMGLGIIGSASSAEKIETRSPSEYDSGEENQDSVESLSRCSHSSTASKKEENRSDTTAWMGEGRRRNNGGQRFRIFRGFVAAVTSAIFGFCVFSMGKTGGNEDILAPT